MFFSHCKSRVSALARECFLSREHWKAKYAQRIDQLSSQIKELESRCQQAEAENERVQKLWQEQVHRTKALEQQLEEAKRSVHLPDDPPRARAVLRGFTHGLECQPCSHRWTA